MKISNLFKIAIGNHHYFLSIFTKLLNHIGSFLSFRWFFSTTKNPISFLAYFSTFFKFCYISNNFFYRIYNFDQNEKHDKCINSSFISNFVLAFLHWKKTLLPIQTSIKESINCFFICSITIIFHLNYNGCTHSWSWLSSNYSYVFIYVWIKFCCFCFFH